MNSNDNILQELNELGSSLSPLLHLKTYEVPAHYFNNLATAVLKNIEPNEHNETALVLNTISKEAAFTTPSGYFDRLDETIMDGIRQHPDYQSSSEEILPISPTLAGIQKINPYHTPVGYFDKIAENFNQEKNTFSDIRVISITNRKWFRMAVAAVTISFFAMTGIFYLTQNNKVDPTKNPDRWMSKNIRPLSTQDIDAFIYANDPGFSFTDMAVSKPEKTAFVKSLLEDVSDSELQHFLDDATFDMDEEDVLLN